MAILACDLIELLSRKSAPHILYPSYIGRCLTSCGSPKIIVVGVTYQGYILLILYNQSNTIHILAIALFRSNLCGRRRIGRRLHILSSSWCCRRCHIWGMSNRPHGCNFRPTFRIHFSFLSYPSFSFLFFPLFRLLSHCRHSIYTYRFVEVWVFYMLTASRRGGRVSNTKRRYSHLHSIFTVRPSIDGDNLGLLYLRIKKGEPLG